MVINKAEADTKTDASHLQVHKQNMRLMGNQFEISIVSTDATWAYARIAEAVTEIQRIERLLTTFDANSQTNLINQFAGIQPVKVDKEVFDLIQRSLPDAETAKASVKLINYRNIELSTEGGTVFLKNEGMRIGFGGIGKGYAADKAKQLLQSKGVKSGIVNASGDLITWGTQPDGSAWTVGVADPNRRNDTFSLLEVSDMAVATSGNYEKYAVINGKRYAHTIDPRTGFSVSGIKSVTIICPHAELADALATPVMVMGVKVGLNMINQMRHIGCIIIDDENKLFTSNNINLKKS
jgi:FAD:protein FMN transferase